MRIKVTGWLTSELGLARTHVDLELEFVADGEGPEPEGIPIKLIGEGLPQVIELSDPVDCCRKCGCPMAAHMRGTGGCVGTMPDGPCCCSADPESESFERRDH